MKNKGVTYLLIIVVAVVWYNLFLRIKSNFVGDDIIIPPSNIEYSIIKTNARDTFKLNANYRDPFQGVSVSTQSALIISNQPEVPKQNVYVAPKIEKVFQWPSVKYYGMLKKANSKKAVGILDFDGSHFNLLEGEYLYDDYQIKAVYRDSLIIKYNKLQKTFYKKKQ